MKPPVKVLEAARNGRGFYGPITVGTSVQLWKMDATPAHLETAPNQRSWTIQRVMPDLEPRGPEWMYIHRPGTPMLYRTDTEVVS